MRCVFVKFKGVKRDFMGTTVQSPVITALITNTVI